MSVKNLLAMLTAVLIIGCGNAFAVTPYATTPPAGTSLLSAVTPAQGTAFLNATSVNTITVTSGGTGYQYQQIAYPTGDGTSYGSWSVYPASPTTKWDKVDDPAAIPDDASTYIDSASTTPYFLFTFPAFSVPLNTTISNLTLYCRVKTSSSSLPVVSLALTVGGTLYDYVGQTCTTSYAKYSQIYTTNPKTGLAWTSADINGTGPNPIQNFGVLFGNVSMTNYLTQVYAVVTYGVPPVVTITPADGNGSGATATAVMVDSNGNPTDAIQSVTVTAHGSGYTTPPQISFSGGNQDATATAALYASTIGGVTVTDPGSGYATAPFVAFNGGGGTLATATALIDATGAISEVDMTSGGSGYTDVPTVSFVELTGNYIGTQYLTSGTTFTPDPGTNQIVVKMVGAGGGGGGSNSPSEGGSGGGAGGYLEKAIRGFVGTATYSIGAAGTAGAYSGTAGSGGNTTFTYGGVTYTAYGGSGGQATSPNAGGAGGTVSANGNLNCSGAPGEASTGDSGIGGGQGGSTLYGGGGASSSAIVSNGNPGTGYGAGGGGAYGATGTGGGGAQGLIIVDEFD